MIQIHELKSAARGRERELLIDVGQFPPEVLDGREHPCVKCGGNTRMRLVDVEAGAVRCSHCFSEKCGDFIAAIQWSRDWSLTETIAACGERLGLNGYAHKRQAEDVVEVVARMKRVPVDVLREFGGHAAKRGDRDVCRIPTYGPDGERCGWFDIGLAKQLRKGLNTKGDPAGLFLRGGKIPEPGTDVVLVEGGKDAAALAGLGYDVVGLPTCKLAGKFATVFRGCRVTIIPDRDTPGEEGAQVSAAVLHRVAESVKVATLPGPVKPKDGDDVRDILAKTDGEQLVRDAIAQAVEWKPEREVSFLSNGDKIKHDDGEVVNSPFPMPRILDDIAIATDGWPRRSGNVLFVHEGAEIAWLEKTAALTGYLGSKTGQPPRFHKGSDFHTAAEVFEELRRTARDYSGVETLPHEPPAPGVYYACPTPEPGDGSRLRELVGRFAPETTVDADLILAMFVTSFWGGAGDRPVFAITSDAGRGAGKTTLAKMVGRLAGGRIEIAADENVEVIKQRLLSPVGFTKRVAVVDNVKSMRFSSAGLEALITADVISGKRMFVGEGQRPNNLLWIVTLNGVSFATDMAQRSVTIKIRRPAYSGTWKEDTEAFIDEHRADLMADCIGFLRSKAVQLDRFTRWASWERAVLSRLPEPPDAQAVIADRQRESDAEGDEAVDLEDYIAGELRGLQFDPERDRVFLPTKVVADWTNAVTAARDSVTKVSRFVRQGIREGRLQRITENTCKAWGRGFVWVGDEADADDQVRTDLESRISQLRAHRAL